MRDRVEALVERALSAIDSAESAEALEEARVRILGRKGELTALLRQMKQVDPDDRPAFGAMVNAARDRVQQELERRGQAMEARERARKLESDTIDVTMPGRIRPTGDLHPLTQGIREVTQIFVQMGFTVVEGPEIETDFYNFEALNTPPFHPARDVQDTFYVNDSVLLRTQTSPMQSADGAAALRSVVVPGKVSARPGGRNAFSGVSSDRGCWLTRRDLRRPCGRSLSSPGVSTERIGR